MPQKTDKPILLELLAPARDAETAIAAIAHGADAVYIGGPAFGARSAAGNSIDDIKRVVDAAAPFGAKVYVTVNTILYDSELDDVECTVAELYKAGVDALIVQDPAMLSLNLPPIDLHASTQWNSDTIDKISMLSRAGFSQIVLPREFSLDMIRKAAESVGNGARLEVFVHGALCVSYSGACHAGQVLAGRSANRGCCPQICRLKFNLTDETGRPVAMPDGGTSQRHWLSLADMNRLASLGALIDVGATSFKIEGRLKPVSYVKNVTAAYSKALDSIVEASDGKYARQSHGRVTYTFTPDTERVFNRGFTGYFLTGADRVNISSWKTPKWIGKKIGTLARVSRTFLTIDSTETINNGDGLGWFDKNGTFHGFRVNRAEGNRLYVLPGADTPTTPGVELYRNNDSSFEALMERADTARRTIGISVVLRALPDGRVALDAADCRGCYVTVTSAESYADKARSSQTDARRNQIARLGDTIYELDSLDDRLGDLFVPASALATLRREACSALDADWNMRRSRLRRKAAHLRADEFAGQTIDYKYNVSNRLAHSFYADHGAARVDDALEVTPATNEVLVMTTAYCLRRELGCCLKTKDAAKLPSRLWLDAPMGRLRLDFDCKNCKMRIFTKPKQ